jgi:hypothetical protein
VATRAPPPTTARGPSTCSSSTNNGGDYEGNTHGHISSRLLGRLESRNLAASGSYPEVQPPTARFGLIQCRPRTRRSSLCDSGEWPPPRCRVTPSPVLARVPASPPSTWLRCGGLAVKPGAGAGGFEGV